MVREGAATGLSRSSGAVKACPRARKEMLPYRNKGRGFYLNSASSTHTHTQDAEHVVFTELHWHQGSCLGFSCFRAILCKHMSGEASPDLLSRHVWNCTVADLSKTALPMGRPILPNSMPDAAVPRQRLQYSHRKDTSRYIPVNIPSGNPC